MVREGVLQSAFNGLQKTTGNLALGRLAHMKKLLEWPMSANFSLESDKHAMAGKAMKHLTKLLDQLHGIGLGYNEGMESRSIMVPVEGGIEE